MALLVGFSAVGHWLIFRLESATPLMMSVGLAAIVTCLVRRRDLSSLGWAWGAWRYQWLSYALPLGTIAAAYVVVTATLSFLLLLPSVLGEELGWRGFLVPELSKWMPFTGVALVSGLLWSVWHWPMIFMGIYGNEGTPLYFQLLAFTLFIVANSFTPAYLRFKSNSVWTAVIFHMSSNVFLQKFFTPITADTAQSAWYVDEFGVVPAFVRRQLRSSRWNRAGASAIHISRKTQTLPRVTS